MEQKAGFSRIDKSDKRMYGPRGLLVCGYDEEERIIFLDFISKISMNDIPVIFAVNEDVGKTLGDLFTHEHKAGITGPSELPRAVIMSGLSQNELHGLMRGYREAGFVKQIWASLTPTSEKWTLKALLIELLAEARAMHKKQ
ncbi:MAG: DUF3783 domain-containing protein [Deltaproteobacteria bacterium]|nr:DUF3783 domain-containing protein [Deltaproteobacteria bacterium]